MIIRLLLAAMILSLGQGDSIRPVDPSAAALYQEKFYQVVPGRFYRSAKLPREMLFQKIEQYGIKTVLRLRMGKDRPNKYGVTERQAIEWAGAAYYDMALPSSRVPERKTVERLLRIFDTADTPILAICSGGTHRTGVVAAIWLLTKERAAIDEALDQLSAKYGFFRVGSDLKEMFQGHKTIDDLLWDYEAAYRASGIDFRTWARETL